MLSIDECKALCEDPNITDKQIKEIRDDMYGLVELAWEKWHIEKIESTINKGG